MIHRRSFLTGLGALIAAAKIPVLAVQKHYYILRTSIPAGSWRMFHQGQPLPLAVNYDIIDEAYGNGPAMNALPALREFNALPKDERSSAIRAYGDEMIRTGEWP